MSIEFAVLPSDNSQAVLGSSLFADEPAGLARGFRDIELSGFDLVVVDHPGGALTNFDIAAAAIQATADIRIVLTHWAGVMDPREAARQIALLSQLSHGRLALRILPDGTNSQPEEAELDSARLWARTDEYLRLLKRLWANDEPFDHEGTFYSLRGAYSSCKPFNADAVPVWMGGLSGTALKVAGRHADMFELFPDTVGEVGRSIERVRAAAAEVGRHRHIRFSLPVRLTDGSRTASQPGYGAAALARYTEAGVSIFGLHADVGLDHLARYRRQIAPVLQAASHEPGGSFSPAGYRDLRGTETFAPR